jgi:hypothetical protein
MEGGREERKREGRGGSEGGEKGREGRREMSVPGEARSFRDTD